MNILLVEDDPVIAAGLEMNLQKMGYEVLGTLPRGEDVSDFIRQNPPDLVLLDIQLEGEWDGIQVAEEISRFDNQPPVIFLTANADAVHFERAKQTQAVAFLSKPYNVHTLQFAIEQALQQAESRASNAENTSPELESPETPPTSDEHAEFFLLKDRVFLKVKDRLVKILLNDIWYVEAESNYSRLWTSHKEYLLSATLKKLENHLPPEIFVRVHRSFVVNISKIDEISEGFVYLGIKQVPLARGFREDLVRRLQML